MLGSRCRHQIFRNAECFGNEVCKSLSPCVAGRGKMRVSRIAGLLGVTHHQNTAGHCKTIACSFRSPTWQKSRQANGKGDAAFSPANLCSCGSSVAPISERTILEFGAQDVGAHIDQLIPSDARFARHTLPDTSREAASKSDRTRQRPVSTAICCG